MHTNIVKKDNVENLLITRWREIQEWIKDNYGIAFVDYTTEILPMCVDSVRNSDNGQYTVYVKLINTDKYLDTYIECRYGSSFSNAARELLDLDCIFHFSSEGYKSSKNKLYGWIKGFITTTNAEKRRGTYIHNERLKNAMMLFKIEDLNSIDKESLKKKRNKLMKKFHPDEGRNNDRYAQLISEAYELLLECDKNRT